jgi:hypothetical protein
VAEWPPEKGERGANPRTRYPSYLSLTVSLNQKWSSHLSFPPSSAGLFLLGGRGMCVTLQSVFHVHPCLSCLDVMRLDKEASVPEGSTPQPVPALRTGRSELWRHLKKMWLSGGSSALTMPIPSQGHTCLHHALEVGL